MNKQLYERPPLIFAEKSPFKIFCIHLKTSLYNVPATERSLNRHCYHTFRKFFSIQRQITDKVLEIQKEIFIGNLINYIFYLNNFFVSVLVVEK